MKKILIIFCTIIAMCGGIAHACESNQIDINGDGTQCVNGKFAIKTTNLDDGDEFKFSMSAQGTFTVDCGEDGTLTSSANDITNGNTITRNNTTQATYTCTYTTGGVKNISFDGTATNYSTAYQDSSNNFYAAIAFSGINADVSTESLTPTKIASVSGNLSAMFPYISGNAASGAQPRFYRLFNGATNLTTVPDTLFANYTRASNAMFKATFYNCTGLTSIPAGLFSSIITEADELFYSTFQNCTSLRTIPAGLFDGITRGARYMFRSTFDGCTSLTSVPAGLFGNLITNGFYLFYATFRGCTNLATIPEDMFFKDLVSGSSAVFRYTFYGCKSLTSIPAGLFAKVTTAGVYMFGQTFSGCSKLTSIPENLFFPNATSVTGQSGHMFYETFSGCSSLTTIPAGLFAKVTSPGDNMFGRTFYNCSKLAGYIPSTTFSGLIANNSPTATDMWKDVFNGTKLATTCPSGTMPYITGYESSWAGKVSCQEVVPVTCIASEYLSATDGMCHVCTNDNYCPGGTYTYNGNDLGKISCGTGLFAPAGMWEPEQCGRILHVGDGFVYLRATKKTEHALHVDLDHDGVADYFGNMTTFDVPMSRETSRKLKVRYNNTTYSIYDDSVDLSLYEN